MNPKAASVDDVTPGSRWIHRKGGEYVVVCLAVREDDLSDVVVYKAGNITGVRLLSQFLDGRFQPKE